METNFSEAALEKLQFTLETYFNEELAHEIATAKDWTTVCSVHSVFLDSLIGVSVRGFIWGEPLQKKTIRAPSNWWQHFKERWFPGWAKRRWPVQYRVEILEAHALYPKVSFPDSPHAIRITDKARMEVEAAGEDD